MFTVGILCPVVNCCIHIYYMNTMGSRMGLIYAMRGLTALSIPTVGQCEGLDSWDGRLTGFPRFLYCMDRNN